jgi:putative endonuclease
MNSRPQPTARQGLGRTGERLAAEALLSKGYSILERNFRCRQGEIDLVAEDEQDIIFVEVKARRGISFGLPEDALTLRKRRKLLEVASYYLLPSHMF